MKAGPLISTLQTPEDFSDSRPAPVFPGITLRPQPLSRGPLAVVYRGWDRTHRCWVAVKVQRIADDPVAASRFGREAAVMRRLRHPSIVSLYTAYDPDPATGRPAALVLEYVSGPTLASLVAEGGHLPLERAVRIIEEIAAALDCVHGAGIIHRDVKPSNILLPRRGSARLTDFGVARILDSARLDDDAPLTVMGDILGTIEYASPEQVHGKGQVDARSDVYSLAAVSYFALTGTPPFRAADSSTQAQLSVMHRQVFSAPPPLRLHRADLPAAVEEAVLRGLAKVPEDRYDSAGQLAAALRSAVLTASAVPQAIAADESARRTGALTGALASAVLLLAGFGVWTLTQHTHAPAEAALPAAPTPRTPQTAALHTESAPQTAASAPPVQPHPLASSAPAVQVPHTGSVPVPKRVPAKLVAAKAPVLGPPARATRLAQAGTKLRVASKTPSAVKPLAAVKAPAVAKASAVFQSPVKQPKRATRLAHAAIKLRSHPSVRAASALAPSKISRPAPRRIIAAQTPKKRLMLPVPTAALVVPTAAPVIPTAWYTVSGWAAIPDDTAAGKMLPVRAAALWVKVDDKPLMVLALGQWATLPAGKHLVTFQPADGMGVGPKTWAIDLAPAAHLNQEIPLPPAPLPLIPPHLRNP